MHNPLPKRSASAPSAPRKRIKLPVPADKYPEYNFVGRLLGPRGTTLKTLERDTRCKIMIRGKGSIRKDKEPEVRGKPGWEHVFNEPLHVVIELADHLDEPAASAALNRARDAVDLLLVPVPEERDGLKRQQLRALAIMNGTFRGAPHPAHDHLPIASYASSPPAQHLTHMHSYPLDPHSAHLFMGDAIAPPPMSSPILSSYEHPPEDQHRYRHLHAHYHHQEQEFDRIQRAHSGRRSPSSGATSPNNTYEPGMDHLSALSVKMQQCAVDDIATSSVGDDSPESSHSSEEGEPSSHIIANAAARGPIKASPASSNAALAQNRTSLGVGGFIGQEFYNGAFSNGGATANPWDQVAPPQLAALSPPHSATLYGFSPIPSPQVLTTSTSTVTPIDRQSGY